MALGSIIDNLQPSSTKSLYQGNYIDFTSSSFEISGDNNFYQMYMRRKLRSTVTVLSVDSLKMVSAELPMSADQVIWTEQGRLHTVTCRVTLCIYFTFFLTSSLLQLTLSQLLLLVEKLLTFAIKSGSGNVSETQRPNLLYVLVKL